MCLDKEGACSTMPEAPETGVEVDSYFGLALDFTVKFGHDSFMYPFVRLFVSSYLFTTIAIITRTSILLSSPLRFFFILSPHYFYPRESILPKN